MDFGDASLKSSKHPHLESSSKLQSKTPLSSGLPAWVVPAVAVVPVAEGRSSSCTVAPPAVVVPAICWGLTAEVSRVVATPACWGWMTENTWPPADMLPPGEEDTTEAGGCGEKVKVGREVMGAAEYTTCCCCWGPRATDTRFPAGVSCKIMLYYDVSMIHSTFDHACLISTIIGFLACFFLVLSQFENISKKVMIKL